MSRVFNPTFIFGLGRMGSEVVLRLQRDLAADATGRTNTVLARIELQAPDPHGQEKEITARITPVGQDFPLDPIEGAEESPATGTHAACKGHDAHELQEKTPGPAKPAEAPLQSAHLVLSSALDDGGRKTLKAFTVAQAWRLLRLSHFLQYSESTSLLPPRFSVFVVADLGEAEVRRVIEPFLQTVGKCLLARYSHIFKPQGPEGEGANFGIYPLFVLGSIRSEDPGPRREISAVLTQVAALARQSAFWWSTDPKCALQRGPCIGRIALLDDQTTKYVLDRSEIVSTLLGFLSIALYCGDLSSARRDDGVWPLAAFFHGDPQAASPVSPAEGGGGLFATFGVATLDVAQQTVSAYVHNRLALCLVESMRPREPVESATMTLRDLWSPAAINERLKGYLADAPEKLDQPEGQPRSIQEQIEKRLHTLSEDLQNRCEAIALSDSPERITNDKYSWPWYENLAQSIQQTCADIEDDDLVKAGDEVDRRGLNLAHTRFDRLRERSNHWVWSEPQGWHRARQHLQELDAQIRREEQRFQLEPELPDLPDTEPLKGALLEVRDLARRWPRRWRLWASGAVAAVLLAVVFHFFPKWLYVRFAYQNDVYIPAASAQSLLDRAKGAAADGVKRAERLAAAKRTAAKRGAPPGYVPDPRYEPPGWLGNPMLFELPPTKWAAHFVVDRPYVFLWLTVLFGLLLGWFLRRYEKRKKAEMDRAIWLLKNRIDDLVQGPSQSAKNYFGRRIQFSRDLWIRRLLKRTADQAREEITRLNVVDQALGDLAHKYREAQKQIGVRYTGPEEDVEDLSQIRAMDPDPLYRRLLSSHTLVTLYEEAVENEGKRVLEFFEKQKMRSPGGSQKTKGKKPARPEWRENPPFADGQRLETFTAEVTAAAAGEVNVLEHLLADDGQEAQKELSAAMRRFFSELSCKLSHGVELRASTSSVAVTRLVLVPEAQSEIFTERYTAIMQDAGLQQAHGQRLQVIGSADAERVHLFVGYSGLQLGDFRWVESPPSNSAPEGEPG
jgi:hypothetical protein